MTSRHGTPFGYHRRKARGFLFSILAWSLSFTRFLAPGLVLFGGSRTPCAARELNAGPTNPQPAAAPASTQSAAASPQEEIQSLKKEQLELAERLLKQFPNQERMLVLMGDVLHCQGRSDEATGFWSKALQVNPRLPRVYSSLGQVAMSRGDYEQAVAHCRKALEIDPRIPDVHSRLGLALMGLGRPKEAVEEMERGLKAGVLSGFDYFVLGQGYLQLGQWDKARAGYESAVKRQPDCTSAYYGLFTVCTRLNDRDKAREYRTTFEKLKAEEMKVLKDRNDAFSDLHEMRLSLATTYVVAGIQYQSCRDMVEAEQTLRRAAELDPQNVHALNELGTLCRGSGRTAEALELYRKAAAIEPPHPACWLNLGILLARSNRFPEAEEALRKAIQLLPDQSDGYREMAQLYLRAQVRLTEARELAEKAVALQPVAQNYSVLSRAYDQNGDPARALAAMKRAMELAPTNQMYRQTYNKLRAREAKP